MAVPVGTLIGLMEGIAPRRLALEGDRERVGLAVGSPESLVQRVMVALDPTPEAVAEAMATGAGLLITHHPLLFHPLSAVRTDTPVGRVVAEALAHGVALFAAHTNLDVVEGGVSSLLAEALGLTDPEVLAETEGEPLLKLVVFVPVSHAEELRRALAEAGAGHLGRYSHCAFSVAGTGTFLPEEGTQPFLGQPGTLARVEEERVETILPERRLEAARRAMRRVHPYEEIAYDVYPLQNREASVGLGRVGRLPQETTLRELADRCKAALGVEHVTYVGDPGRRLTKVAVCGGSAGSDLVAEALFRGAEALVCGEFKYHDALFARQQGVAVIAAGHDATERVVVPALVRRLRDEAERQRLDVDVVEAGAAGALWRLG